MNLKSLTLTYIPAIETELQKQVSRLDQPHTRLFHEMLTYHMGWTGEGAGPEATGKRIRPLMVLLATAATGGKWEHALPAAAAVELVHNFSLVHDDIQDNSEKRRGRSTVWDIVGRADGDQCWRRIICHFKSSNYRSGKKLSGRNCRESRRYFAQHLP